MAEHRRASTAQAVRQTLQQRGAEATRSLREALHLPADLNDTTILGTALAEAAAAESRRNPQFAADVRQRYDDLAALRGATAKRAPAKAPEEPLVPLRHLDVRKLDAFAPPNPRDLIYVYGADKLGRALQEYTLDRLKVTVANVQREHPGTKPTSMARKQAVIDYIVQYSQE